MYHPQRYSRNIEPFVKITKSVFEKNKKLLKWNSDPESILDLGIGDGRMTKEVMLPVIPENIKEYVGGDISEVMLLSAKNTVSHDKFKTVMIDAQAKSVPEEMKNRFHHIFANHLLHHTQDVRQTLTNIRDMLKPGGQFMFNAFEEVFTDEAFDKLDQGKWSKYHNYKAISPFYNHENPLEEYKKLIEAVGFVHCHIYSEHFKVQLPEESFDELMSSANKRQPFVEEEDREDHMRDFIAECRKTKMVERITDNNKTMEKTVHTCIDLITGIMSKPT